MDDLISRQAAIDEIEITSFDDHGDYIRAREIIENLPSVQPDMPEFVESVERRYNKALCTSYIEKPLAWALYQKWKEYDDDE